jgi:tetratricopeptide (TPR) repeat protein
MKGNKVFLLFFFILFSCSEKSPKKQPKSYNPSEEIPQVLTTEEAQKYFDLGEMSRIEGDFNSAYIFLNFALEYEESPIIYNDLGMTATAEKKYDEAIKYFSESKKIDSKYWPTYINESNVYILTKNSNKAEDLLLNMIKKCDSDYFISFANFQLAMTYSQDLQNCEKALNYLKKTELIQSDFRIKEKIVHLKSKIENNCR